MEWMSDYGLVPREDAHRSCWSPASVRQLVASVVRRGRAMRMYGPLPQIIHLNRRHRWMVAAFERQHALEPRVAATAQGREGRAQAPSCREATGGGCSSSTSRVTSRRAGIKALREEVTLILANATENDEVVVRLENSGGAPSGHGLGASQLARIRARNIHLTVAVDRFALSGGYMMACVASWIIAAPFAVVGSIGTFMMIANFHRLLESKGVDVEKFQSGEFKLTVSMLGENTETGRAKLQEQLEDMHRQFRDFVSEHRPALDIDRVSTGEFWSARDAAGLHLVDEIRTSDDYLYEAGRDADVYLVRCAERRGLRRRFRMLAERALERASSYLGP